MPTTTTDPTNELTDREVLFEYLLRLADDRLILGHRLSEWCGHGPILEEDIALANIALDNIGHAASLYEYAAAIEGKDRHRDELVYFRNDVEYRNIQMVELPRGDFAFTIARQLLFSAYSYFLYQELKETDDEQFSGMAGKHFKEIKYHLRHSREWVLRLGDGTEESHRRMQDAFDEIWMYTGEFFYSDQIDAQLLNQGLAADAGAFRDEWETMVSRIITDATLEIPDFEQYMAEGGRKGRHTEHLGPLLAEMQHLRRSYPDAEWE